MTANNNLGPELIWALRALAQPFDVQVGLYPDFVCVADELVEDWGEEYDKAYKGRNGEQEDLENLDKLIISRSGKPEYWTEEALKTSMFWSEIRHQAEAALIARGVDPTSPGPSTKNYIQLKDS